MNWLIIYMQYLLLLLNLHFDSDSSSSILSVDNNKNLDGWIDPEEQESDESGKIVDYRLKYFKLKGDYEKHITQLMTRLSQEQQSKITLEERLEDALVSQTTILHFVSVYLIIVSISQLDTL